MALETLKEIMELDEESVAHYGEFLKGKAVPFSFIEVDHDSNSILFRIQNGPIKENGKNGCQVDHMIIAARTVIAGLNDKFPCRENALAITKLDEALMWLKERKADRVKRGVEGTDNV